MKTIEKLHEIGDYRAFLDVLFTEKRQKNSRYSIRALARDLGLSTTFLHCVLHGTRSFSYEMTLKVGRRLGFDNYSIEYLYMLVQFADSLSEEEKELLQFRGGLIMDAAARGSE